MLSFFASMGVGLGALYCVVGPTSFAKFRNKLAQQAEADGLEDVYFSRFAILPACGIAAIVGIEGHFNFLAFALIAILHRYLILLFLHSPLDAGRQIPKRLKHWKLDLLDGFTLAIPSCLSALLPIFLIARS